MMSDQQRTYRFLLEIEGMAHISKLQAALTVLLIFMAGNSLPAETQYNMTEGVTEISHLAYDLHMLITYICLGIGVITFGAMFYSMWAHRRSVHPEPAKFTHSTGVEIVWTTIPLLILIGLAVPATKALILMEDAKTDADMTVLVTGSQWKWHYKYLDGEQKGIEFFSILSTPKDVYENYDDRKVVENYENYLLEVDNPLVIPAGRKVRFLITSDDVIHSWWVPDFAVKNDAIPGFINDAWALTDEVGTYRGQCTELCGVDHGFMPVVVEVLSLKDFASWVGDQKQAIADVEAEAAAAAARSWSMEDLLAKGEEVYNGRCAVCHKTDGSGTPPVFPALINGPISTGPIADHIEIVIHGKAGTAMQAFGAQLSDAEIAAVVTYERNAWGNNKGDLVQPGEIATAKNN